MLSTQRSGYCHDIADKIEKIQKDFEKEWSDQEKSNVDWCEVKQAIRCEAKNFEKLNTVASITSRFLEIKNYWKIKNKNKMEDGFYRGGRLLLMLTESFFLLKLIPRISEALSFDDEKFDLFTMSAKIKYIQNKENILEDFFEYQANKDHAIEFLQFKMKEFEKSLVEYLGNYLEWLFSFLNPFSWTQYSDKWSRISKAANTLQLFAAEINAALSSEAKNNGNISLQERQELFEENLSQKWEEIRQLADNENNERKIEPSNPARINTWIKPNPSVKPKKTPWYTFLYDRPWKKGVLGGIFVLGLVALGLTGWGLIAELSAFSVISIIGGLNGALLIGGVSFMVPLLGSLYKERCCVEGKDSNNPISYQKPQRIRGSMSVMPFKPSSYEEEESQSLDSKYSAQSTPVGVLKPVSDCHTPKRRHSLRIS